MNPLRLTITATDEVISHLGYPVRVWEGVTPDGKRCVVLVAAVGVDRAADQTPFQTQLVELKPLPFLPDPELN